jgi:8-oxo-dGTP diphosphatase
MKYAAGTLLISNDTGRFLLVKRGKLGSEPGTWATVGGGIDHLEKPLDAAKRELYEETKIDSDQVRIDFKFFEKQTFKNTEFYFFLGYCDDELDCRLNEENDDWGWFDMENLPSPLFPTMFSSLQRIF